MSQIIIDILETERTQVVEKFLHAINAIDAQLATLRGPGATIKNVFSGSVPDEALAEMQRRAEAKAEAAGVAAQATEWKAAVESQDEVALVPEPIAEAPQEVDLPPLEPAPVLTAQQNAAQPPWKAQADAAAATPPASGRRTNEQLAAEQGVELKDVKAWKDQNGGGRVVKADIEEYGRLVREYNASQAQVAAPVDPDVQQRQEPDLVLPQAPQQPDFTPPAPQATPAFVPPVTQAAPAFVPPTAQGAPAFVPPTSAPVQPALPDGYSDADVQPMTFTQAF